MLFSIKVRVFPGTPRPPRLAQVQKCKEKQKNHLNATQRLYLPPPENPRVELRNEKKEPRHEAKLNQVRCTPWANAKLANIQKTAEAGSIQQDAYRLYYPPATGGPSSAGLELVVPPKPNPKINKRQKKGRRRL